MTAERRKVDFSSAGSRCAAWHYLGHNGACVIMAAGLAVIKEPGADPLARRFSMTPATPCLPSTTIASVKAAACHVNSCTSAITSPIGTLPSTATNSPFGDSRHLADMSSALLPTTQALPRRSLTRPAPTESTPCATRSGTPPRAHWRASPVVLPTSAVRTRG